MPTKEQLAPEAADQQKLDDIVRKDAKSGRSLTGWWYLISSALGIFMVLFYLYNSGFIPADAQWHRGTYVLITYILVFIFYPIKEGTSSGRPSILDISLALIATVAVGYWIIEFENLNYRMGSENQWDTLASFVGIIISLEVARRVLGWSMTIVGLVFLAYAFWGNLLEYIPFIDVFAHDGFSFKRALNHIYLKQEGVFGIMADVLVTYVILFIFFGSFLKASGCSRFFLDLPMAIAGRSVGGPAKVAVMASGFFGSVSGSAIANTVSTGAFTIPLMKKAGFRPHVAGAIEPAASIGGMFMPPIMGAGGFLMAEMTEIPYVDIMKMAIFPAVIYFLSVFVMIHFEAKRYGLVGIKDPNAKSAWQILKEQWLLSLPLVLIVTLMLFAYSPGYAAFVATIACVVVGRLMPTEDYSLSRVFNRAMKYCLGPLIAAFAVAVLLEFNFLESISIAFIVAFCANPYSPNGRMSYRVILNTMIEGSRNTLIIGATVGVIGIIVGTIALTGIGLKFSDIIISLSGGILPLAILLIGLASLILGMGVPVTAAYLITAVLAVGAVSNMISQTMFGMPYSELSDIIAHRDMIEYANWALIASHMIVYWFSQDSNITPPVCVAAYAGAAIAGSDPWKTGWTSFKFAKMLYIGPFLFAFSPGFLLGGTWSDIVMAYFTITLGTIAFGSLTMGYLLCSTNVVEWLIFAAATALLFFPQLLTSLVPVPDLVADGVGVGLWVLVYFMQKVRIKKDPTLTLPIGERNELKAQAAAG